MPAKPPIGVPGRGTFPSADQLPLGSPDGAVNAVPEPPSAVRPFGLTVAVPPRDVATVKQADFIYDEDAQIGRVREGDLMVPLSRHTDGPTNTVTDRGDGQSTNRDSDSDYRED